MSSNLQMKPVWTLLLETVDLRLVLKALGGRLTTPEEIQAARLLGDRLDRIRAETTKTALEQASKLLSNVDAAGGES